MEDTEAGELDPLTIEEASLFEAAYPEVVAVFQKQQSETQRKKQKSKCCAASAGHQRCVNQEQRPCSCFYSTLVLCEPRAKAMLLLL